MRVGAACLLSLLSTVVSEASAQVADTAREPTQVTASVTVTNKGISTVPSFTLGKPAAILDLAIRKGRLGFEPQFRYGLDGKPRTFLFWGRYRLHDGARLRVSVGAHRALAFRSVRDSTSEVPGELIVARRYLAGR